MKTKASYMNHPFHPMLIVFPLGLWIFSFICLVISKFTDYHVWNTISIYTLAGGIIGGAIAAVPGLIDLFALPQSKARTIGIWHMIINIIILTILIITFFLKVFSNAEQIAFIFFAISIILLLVSGWLGGELVYHYGVAVSTIKDESYLNRNPSFKAAGHP